MFNKNKKNTNKHSTCEAHVHFRIYGMSIRIVRMYILNLVSVCVVGNAFLTLELLWAVMRVDIKRSGRVILYLHPDNNHANTIARRHNDYYCCIAVWYCAWDSAQFFFYMLYIQFLKL